MKKSWALCALPLIASLATPARADATLDYHWSDVRCGYTSGGVTTYGECSSPSFSATVADGGSVFVSATFNYTYHDDGLRLGTPTSFQLDPRGFNMLRVDNEAAIIYFNNFGSGPPFPPDRTFSTNLPIYLMLGNNTTPDDITGQQTFSWTTTAIPNYYPGPATLTLGAGLGVLHTQIAAVPEPSTMALMGLGLAGLVGFTGRRRRAAVQA